MIIGWRLLTQVAGRITEVEIPSAAACGDEHEEQPNGHQEPGATGAARVRFHRARVGLTHYPKSRFSSSYNNSYHGALTVRCSNSSISACARRDRASALRLAARSLNIS